MLIKGIKTEGKVNKQKKTSLIGNSDGTVYFKDVEVYEKEPDYIENILNGTGELILTKNDIALEMQGDIGH